MSDDTKSAPASTPAAPPAAAPAATPAPAAAPAAAPAKAADSATPAAGGEKATSGRAAMGGKDAVHYGFFSNVKTPEYKSGWDDIWGKKKTRRKSPASKSAPAKRTAPKAAVIRKSKPPVSVELDFADLPAAAQDALAASVRAELKKQRIGYDSRAKAGRVSWRIACEVKR